MPSENVCFHFSQDAPIILIPSSHRYIFIAFSNDTNIDQKSKPYSRMTLWPKYGHKAIYHYDHIDFIVWLEPGTDHPQLDWLYCHSSERSSKTSAVTFLGNFQFPQFESFKFQQVCYWKYTKRLKCAFGWTICVI